MGAKTGSNGSNSAIVEINVIPLVDIILVVLIIFMVAAPLVMQPKIDISLPKSTSAKVEKDKVPMKITVGKKGELFLNNDAISIEGLKDAARKMVEGHPETSALLIADKEVTLAMVTDIVDAVKNGGVKKVAFSIEKR